MSKYHAIVLLATPDPDKTRHPVRYVEVAVDVAPIIRVDVPVPNAANMFAPVFWVVVPNDRLPNWTDDDVTTNVVAVALPVTVVDAKDARPPVCVMELWSVAAPVTATVDDRFVAPVAFKVAVWKFPELVPFVNVRFVEDTVVPRSVFTVDVVNVELGLISWLVDATPMMVNVPLAVVVPLMESAIEVLAAEMSADEVAANPGINADTESLA